MDEETCKAEYTANVKTCVNTFPKEHCNTFTEEVKESGVTVSPGEKHGDYACAT